MWVASVDRIGGEPDNSIEYVTFSPATWSSDNARRVNQTYACNRRASKLQSWTDEHGCAIMTTVRGALLCSHCVLLFHRCERRTMWKLDQVSGSWESGGRRGGGEGERVLDLCTRCRMFAAEMHNRNTRQRNTGNLNSIQKWYANT